MNQEKKVREYIEYLFQNAPKTRAAVDLREEIISNAEEKMADLLAQGYKEEDAFAIVVHSIGNVEELFAELRSEEQSEAGAPNQTAVQKKRAVLTAAAVGMYIFALVVFLIFAGFSDYIPSYMGMDVALMGLVIAGLFCIPPTCMLIYSSMMLPTYKKKENNMVEEYKEWKSENSRDKAIKKAVETIIWTFGTVVYLVLSFMTGAWHITWVIFLILGCIDSIVALAFSLKK